MRVPRHWLPQRLWVQLLLALALIGILPLGIVGVGIAMLERDTLSDVSARELSGLARGLAGELDRFLMEFLNDTRAIAALPEMTQMNLPLQGLS